MDSVHTLILADRRITIEDISEQLGISVDTVHKTVHDDLAFSKVSHCWVSPDNARSHIATRTVVTIRYFG